MPQSEVLSLWQILELLRAGLPVTVGSLVLGAGTNNIGDVDVASLPATVIAGMATLPTGTNTIGATKDAGAAWTTVYTYTASADMSTPAAITAAPTAGQKICIDDIVFSSDTALSMEFEEESSGTVIFKIYIPANGSVQITPRGKVKLPVADKKLFGDASASGNVAITVTYHSEV